MSKDFQRPKDRFSCYYCCCKHDNFHGPICYLFLSVILTLYFFLLCFVPFFVGKSQYDGYKKKYPDFTFLRPSTSVLVCHWFLHIYGMLFSISIGGIYFFGMEPTVLAVIGVMFLGMAASYISYLCMFYNCPEYDIRGNVISYDQFLEYKQKIKNSKINAIVSFSGTAKLDFGSKKSGRGSFCYSDPYANVFPGINSTEDLSVFPPNPPRDMLFRVNTIYDIGLNDTYVQRINQYIKDGVACLRENWFIATNRRNEHCNFEGEKYFGVPDVYDQYYVSNSKKKPVWMGLPSIDAAAIFGLGAYTVFMVRSVPIYKIRVVRELIHIQTEEYLCQELAVNIQCRDYKLLHNDIDPQYWWGW